MGHEEDLCEALIQMLEEDYEGARSNVSHPERDGSGPPVEVRLQIAGRSIAIEHTLIEPFPRAIQTGKEFDELTSQIERKLNGAMPTPGTYYLLFPVHPTEGLHRRNHDEVRSRIIDWIGQAGKELHDEFPERRDRHRSPHGYKGTRTTEIEGIQISLSRHVHWAESGRHDGALFLSRVVGRNVEDLRLIRMRTALAKKLPKLRDCAELGDTTFLILEWSDIALSNQVVIAEALRTALDEREDWPDYVMLADTATERWHFFRPVVHGDFTIDMEYIDIDRSRLIGANVSA